MQKRLLVLSVLILFVSISLISASVFSDLFNRITGKATASCGNGVIEAGESCDGTKLGSFTCSTFGFDSGTLGCTSTCKIDTSKCSTSSITTETEKPIVTLPSSNNTVPSANYYNSSGKGICNDTDGGENFYEKGTANGILFYNSTNFSKNYSYDDRCFNRFILRENFCQIYQTEPYVSPAFTYFTCAAEGYTCSNGACDKTSSSPAVVCSLGSLGYNETKSCSFKGIIYNIKRERYPDLSISYNEVTESFPILDYTLGELKMLKNGISIQIGLGEDDQLIFFDSIYPEHFVGVGTADVAIVYGTKEGVSALELVAAGNIQSSLQSYIPQLGDVLVKDYEASAPAVSRHNLIVVGSIGEICSNSAMFPVAGSPISPDNACELLKENLGIQSGQFFIGSYANPWQSGKIALLVVGYNAVDIVNAATYLRTQTVQTSIGSKYIGTSATTTCGSSSSKLEIAEGQNIIINGLNITLLSSDENNLNLEATLKIGKFGDLDYGDLIVVLNNNNPIQGLTGNNNQRYLLELLTASDTSATISVTFACSETTCTDSDGGKDYNVKGKIDSNAHTSTSLRIDQCEILVESDEGLPNYLYAPECSGEICYLAEGFCDESNRPNEEKINCQYSSRCSDGRCLTVEEACKDKGCLVNNKICADYGTVKRSQFCATDGNFKDQLGFGETCSNDFECRSNKCIENVCIQPPSLLERIRKLVKEIFAKEGSSRSRSSSIDSPRES